MIEVIKIIGFVLAVAMTAYGIGYWFTKGAIAALKNDSFEVNVTHRNILKPTSKDN